MTALPALGLSLAVLIQGNALYCSSAESIAASLARLGERAVAGGASTARAGFLNIFVSPEGTWTAVLLLPGARACIIDVGEGWQPRPTAEREG